MNTFGQYSLSGGCKLAHRLLFPPCLVSDLSVHALSRRCQFGMPFFQGTRTRPLASGALRSESFQEKPSHSGIVCEAGVSMVGGIDFNHVQRMCCT